MDWKKLAETDYESYFNTLSKGLKNQLVEIEIMAIGVFDKEQTSWITLYGISYDPSEKIVSVICEHIDHHIKKAQEVNIFEGDAGVQSIEIIGGGGYKHVLKFKTPVKI